MKKTLIEKAAKLHLPHGTSQFFVDFESDLKGMVFDTALNIYEPCAELLSTGGKRLRPLLVYISGLSKSSTKEIIDSALAVELIHIGSLVHDDVIDQTNFRRGKPTLHTTMGNKVAISVGDYIFSESVKILAKNGSPKAVGLLIASALDMSQGQLEELRLKGDVKITKEDYFSIIRGKSASLFATSCGLGGIASGLDDEQVESLISYGMNIGMAFQILDDVLDMTGSGDLMGKPVGNDLFEQTITLPAIYGMNMDKNIENMIKELMSGEKSRQTVTGIIDLIITCGAVDSAKRDAIEFTEIALNHSRRVDAKISKYLVKIANSLLKRIN